MARVVASLKKIIPLTYHFTEEKNVSRTRPWIVITHHFGGSSTSSLRHVKALSSIGFDCVTFDFSWHGATPRHPFLFKVLDMWTHDIIEVLEQLDETEKRDKIFLSFSGPTMSALQSIKKRFENDKFDIKGIICDSGPFIEPKNCTRSLIEQLYGITQPLKREVLLGLMMFLWGSDADEKLIDTVDYIEKEKSDFPILSIRGLKDSLVPAENIRRVFEKRKLGGLETLELECGHLTGLKEQPALYKAALRKFLEKWI